MNQAEVRETLRKLEHGEIDPDLVDWDELLPQLPDDLDPCQSPWAKAARMASALWFVDETMARAEGRPTGKPAPSRWWMDLTLSAPG